MGFINLRSTRYLLLCLTGMSLAMIAVRVSSYPQLLRLPGAPALLGESSALLLLYAALILWFTRESHSLPSSSLTSSSLPSRVFFASTAFGVTAALVQIIHLGLERFIVVPGVWNGRVVLALMLLTFAIWGMAGFKARRSGLTIPQSARMAAWSAIVTMSIAIVIGVALELFLAPIPPESMLAWPEFQRSGWTDLHAFAIANTLDSVVSHTLIAPIVGLIVGSIGSLLAQSTASSRARTETSPRTDASSR